MQLANHVYGTLGVNFGEFLRGGYDDEAVEFEVLHDRERRVRGAGRQVDDEVVEFAPFGGLQQLVDGVMHHRPTPDNRLFLVLLKEAHGHDLDTEALGRQHLVALANLRTLGDLHGAHHIRAVYIHVEDAHAVPFVRECGGEIHGDGRLAHAALAAVHTNLVADLRQRVCDLTLLLKLASHRLYALARVRLLLRIHSHSSSSVFQLAMVASPFRQANSHFAPIPCLRRGWL